jgi:hypothetical protein
MNLERYTAEHGQKIAHIVCRDGEDGPVDGDKAENCVRKALGVLQESGVFALILFCLSQVPTNGQLKDEGRAYLKIVKETIELLGCDETSGLGLAFTDLLPEHALREAQCRENLLNYVRDNLLADHRTTFLVRHLFEQTLNYALFGIQALK